MVIKNVNLETVCGITSTLPDNTMPELAFAGKSNVGKSSLINGLMNRKNYARTSQEPGKTQTINYYNINNEFYLVDLPGYGFARVSEKTKQQWGKMIENYLHSSQQLRAVFLLLDIRHTPSENDVQMFEWMVYQGFTPIILATKMDKLRPSQVEEQVTMIRDTLSREAEITVIPCSAETREGRDEIWKLMDELVGYQEEQAGEEKKAKDPERKPRWKDTERPTAKKTAAKQAAKKKANVEAAQKERRAAAKEAARKEAEKKAREAERKARKAAAKRAAQAAKAEGEAPAAKKKKRY